MKRVLALQHIAENPPGLVGELLEEHNIQCDVVHIAEEAPPDPILYSAMIVFGGSQHVYDSGHFPHVARENAMILKAVQEGIPFLGICLGGQLLANALGGSVRRQPPAKMGFLDVQLMEAGREDPLYHGFPGYEHAFHWHEDTFQVPGDATLLSIHETSPVENRAFRYGRRAYGLQYHIELTEAMLHTWLTEPILKQEFIDVRGLAAYEEIEREAPVKYPHYRRHSRMLIKNFFRIAELL